MFGASFVVSGCLPPAAGDNGKELRWFCALSNCWEEHTGGDDQNHQEEGKVLVGNLRYVLGLVFVFGAWKKLLLLSSWKSVVINKARSLWLNLCHV